MSLNWKVLIFQQPFVILQPPIRGSPWVLVRIPLHRSWLTVSIIWKRSLRWQQWWWCVCIGGGGGWLTMLTLWTFGLNVQWLNQEICRLGGFNLAIVVGDLVIRLNSEHLRSNLRSCCWCTALLETPSSWLSVFLWRVLSNDISLCRLWKNLKLALRAKAAIRGGRLVRLMIWATCCLE